MSIVTVHNAKTHLSDLLRRVEEGEEIIIARGRKPVARLIPHASGKAPGKPGFGMLKGRGWADDALLEPLDEGELARWS